MTQEVFFRKSFSAQWTKCICISNHMFKREIWDKFTEFTFLIFEIEGDFNVSENQRDRFCPNFISKHVIPIYSHVTGAQGAREGKNYTKNNQSVS